jgi:hypothetical protein
MNNSATIAGDRWRLVAQTIRGGFAIKVVAAHITWMLGDNEWHRPVWRERAVPPDGKTFQTATFDKYLLLPEREGLDLPSLLAVHKLCEADPKYGAQAIAMLRGEIAEYDQRIKADHNGVLDALPRLAAHGGDRRSEAAEHQVDNVNLKHKGGNSASYLAARLKRDHPPIWAAYIAEQYPSLRAAALAAGILKPPSALALLRQGWKRATPEERAAFLAETDLVACQARSRQ